MENNNDKNRVIHFVMGVIAVILTLSVSVCILTFLTNGVIEIDVDSNAITSYFDRISVTTVIEQIRDKEESPIVDDETLPQLTPKISFFGDSISTYTGETTFNVFYPAGDVDSVDKTWWKIVASQSGCTLGSNSSSSGSTVVDNGSYSGLSDERVQTVDPETTVLYVFMGMNDYWQSVAVSDFEQAYTSMLQKLHTQCPNASIRCMLLYKTSFDTNGRFDAYNTAIRNASNTVNAQVIDLTVLDMEDDTMTQETDVHVHPTLKGMEAIAGVVMGTYVPPQVSVPQPQPPLPGIPNPTPAPAPPSIVNPNGWYADIAYGSGVGTSVGTLDTGLGVDIYDGLPWIPTTNTYIYYQYKAKEDIYALFESAGISRGQNSSKVVNSAVNGYATTANIDGITALAVGVTPAMLDRDYYPNSCSVSGAAAGDSSSTRWNLKIACVVVKAGESKSDSSKYLYIPCTKVDAKGHTWYGGVAQTNVKVSADHQLQISTNNSGSAYVTYTVDDNKSITTMLAEVNAELNKANKDMGAWYKNEIETYNLSSSVVSAIGQYDVVGWVVYK